MNVQFSAGVDRPSISDGGVDQDRHSQLHGRDKLTPRHLWQQLPRRVQKYKRVAKPLMVALSMIMTDKLGDGLARGS